MRVGGQGRGPPERVRAAVMASSAHVGTCYSGDRRYARKSRLVLLPTLRYLSLRRRTVDNSALATSAMGIQVRDIATTDISTTDISRSSVLTRLVYTPLLESAASSEGRVLATLSVGRSAAPS
jgi:hypothetical protein